MEFLADSCMLSAAPTAQVTVMRWQNGKLTQALDFVAEEVPIAFVYNGISHAVMLATAQDLTDFALGFSLSEGILHDKSDLYGVDVMHQSLGIELRLEIASACFVHLKERRRNLLGRTGCGLCGAESLDQALRLPPVANQQVTHSATYTLSAAHIQSAFHAIQTKQILQQATGATHACAWVNALGEIVLVREDVGRHNAMDKLIGALAKLPQQGQGFVITSSRASVEMVQKVATAGIQVLVAISAPTGLAIRIAETYGVTLVGFLRDQQFVIYTHQHRIQF